MSVSEERRANKLMRAPVRAVPPGGALGTERDEELEKRERSLKMQKLLSGEKRGGVHNAETKLPHPEQTWPPSAIVFGPRKVGP